MSSGLLVVAFMAWCAMGMREGGGSLQVDCDGELLLSCGLEVTALDPVTGDEHVLLTADKDEHGRLATFGRPCYLRRRRVIVVPTGRSGDCDTLLLVSSRRDHRQQIPLGEIVHYAIVVSPDERWIAYRGDNRGTWGTWAVEVGNWSNVRSLPISVESALDMTWSGGWIYYSTYTKESGYEVRRYEWETGKEEELPWGGGILGIAGHDPEMVLWRKEGAGMVKEVWGWRRGTPVEETMKLWEAGVVGRSAAVMGEGYVIEGVRLVNGWFVDWGALLGATLTEVRGLYWVVPGRKYAPRIGRIRHYLGMDWIPGNGNWQALTGETDGAGSTSASAERGLIRRARM